ncbi:MAG: hypothetical protein K2P68_01315 [Sphingomonas sp.]|nr:hypothetical protein [Sphingomonas sp.]
MAANYPSQSVTPSWVDLCAVNSSLAGKSLSIQCVGGHAVEVYFGGVSAPTGAGTVLYPGAAVTGTAAHIWIRGSSGGTVSILEND